ncbi:hypothetical protein BJ508DRAFT_100633 [Ascobolus immersus RN42]|uniref:Transmembrane protein n=1 Tax=Ascobolus immersus RN42 TaxID=1160509 RepID=A0A3N4ICW4_ASCIM|nr:hypothetical protein BJ508DRAFT_100633 [Ascobolus immersus RN42]
MELMEGVVWEEKFGFRYMMMMMDLFVYYKSIWSLVLSGIVSFLSVRIFLFSLHHHRFHLLLFFGSFLSYAGLFPDCNLLRVLIPNFLPPLPRRLPFSTMSFHVSILPSRLFLGMDLLYNLLFGFTYGWRWFALNIF